jgi:cytochrome c oxidase assembly protein Cox11
MLVRAAAAAVAWTWRERRARVRARVGEIDESSFFMYMLGIAYSHRSIYIEMCENNGEGV